VKPTDAEDQMMTPALAGPDNGRRQPLSGLIRSGATSSVGSHLRLFTVGPDGACAAPTLGSTALIPSRGAGHPSTARAGEGKGERKGGLPTHGSTRWAKLCRSSGANSSTSLRLSVVARCVLRLQTSYPIARGKRCPSRESSHDPNLEHGGAEAIVETIVAFVAGIGVLFFLNRDHSARTSKALWLPVIWLCIHGARPPSFWLGMELPREIPGQLPAASPLDQSVAALLILFGVLVIRRRRHARAVLRASWPILLYFSFCLVSLLWSDFPGWGFKRWVRAVGELVMVLIVVTDAQPAAALRRLLSRVGFVLLPASVFLIEYYPDLGTAGYAKAGYLTYVGVTDNKNALGAVTFLLALGTLWQVLSFLRDRQQPNRARRLLAQCTLLSIGIWLLYGAHSATSGASFALGAGLMLATALPPIGRRPASVHALVMVILLGGALTMDLVGRAEVFKGMGRRADLTGRTEVWKVLIPMAPNPIVGTGYETFWVGPRVATVARMFHNTLTNEAHNGYIEVYLNLGWVGLGLIVLIFGQGYRTAVGAFRRDPILGGLFLTYIVTGATYNISEAGFRMPGPVWFFLLLSVVAASRVTGVEKEPAQTRQELADPTSLWATAIPSTSTRLA